MAVILSRRWYGGQSGPDERSPESAESAAEGLAAMADGSLIGKIVLEF